MRKEMLIFIFLIFIATVAYAENIPVQASDNQGIVGLVVGGERFNVNNREIGVDKEKGKIESGDASAETELEIETETENNQTKLKVNMPNGRNAEIKIMPDTASERALERLRLRVCSAENNCTIVLKDTGERNETNDARLAYELQIERHYRLLWMFKLKAENKAQIDAETGEVILVKKPWWAFLARAGD